MADAWRAKPRTHVSTKNCTSFQLLRSEVITCYNIIRFFILCVCVCVCMRVFLCVLPSEMECVLFYSRKIAHRAKLFVALCTRLGIDFVLSYLIWLIMVTFPLCHPICLQLQWGHCITYHFNGDGQPLHGNHSHCFSAIMHLFYLLCTWWRI